MTSIRRLAMFTGVILAGQGMLVITRVLDHEAPLWMGGILVVVGAITLAAAQSGRLGQGVAKPKAPDAVLAAAASIAALSTILYTLARGTSLGLPKLSILAYCGLLVGAAIWPKTHIGPVPVRSLVAYSFPLLAAPLALWATAGAIAATEGPQPLEWYTKYTLILPMAAILSALGVDSGLAGNTLQLQGPDGAIFLTVGVVCAGLYATILFMGTYALFAAEHRPTPWKLGAYLALGIAGLHVANLARLVALGAVGAKWGGAALQAFHQHAGWLLFLGWGIAFWWLVLRRFELVKAQVGPPPTT